VDSTLREGLQTAGKPIFIDQYGPIEYVTLAHDSGLVDRFEVTWSPSLTPEALDKIKALGAKGVKLQAYVGPLEYFQPTDRPDLNSTDWTLVSTTLLHGNIPARSDLTQLQDRTNGAPLRVGLECSGSNGVEEVIETVATLSSYDEVEVISINDSNGRMSIEWIESFFGTIAGIDTNGHRIGFHIHNGELRAKDKAKLVLKCAELAGLVEIDLDATAFGLGDRSGILSIDDAAQLIGKGVAIESISREIAGLFFKINRKLGDLPDVAMSHYNNGIIRPEYASTTKGI
jgi:hypothetical protein